MELLKTFVSRYLLWSNLNMRNINCQYPSNHFVLGQKKKKHYKSFARCDPHSYSTFCLLTLVQETWISDTEFKIRKYYLPFALLRSSLSSSILLLWRCPLFYFLVIKVDTSLEVFRPKFIYICNLSHTRTWPHLLVVFDWFAILIGGILWRVI
jgi:hypothetical protein